MPTQRQHKQKHGTSNTLSNPQRFSSTIDEDVRVEDDSNNHRNNQSNKKLFSLRLESIGLVNNGDNSRWDDMFKLLLEFKQKHGHFKISCDCGNENKKLLRWVYNRRRDYREYKRTDGENGDPERMKRLESIGLVDDITTKVAKEGRNKGIWYDMYNQLIEFKQKHGHVKVPARYNENKKLGTWVRNWRRDYREYKRTDGQKGNPERMKCLESIGLFDDITTKNAKEGNKGIWYDMYNQLIEFKQKYGHVKVPQQYNENKKLGRWVVKQRSKYREYKQTNGQKGDPERMKCLESIGLVDDITTKVAKKGNKKIWYDMYNQLIEFKQKHGHVKVPARYSENKKLGTWVMYWRSALREYKRTDGQKGDPEQMKHLESIGLVDDICIRIHQDKITKCANIKVSAPMIALSMSPTFSSHTQNITKEIPLLAGMKGEEQNDDNSGGVNDTQADLDFLGSELRGKGGFWV
jgi:predicted HAD superfamily phosphohydrolase YqeG